MEQHTKDRLEEQKNNFDRMIAQNEEKYASRIESLRLEFKDKLEKVRQRNMEEKKRMMNRIDD